MARQKSVKGIILYQDRNSKEVYFVLNTNQDCLISNAVKKPIFALNNKQIKDFIIKSAKHYTRQYAMNNVFDKLQKYADKIVWYSDNEFIKHPYPSLDFEMIE